LLVSVPILHAAEPPGEPGAVLGFALMTSADSTKSAAEADYDDFQLLPPE